MKRFFHGLLAAVVLFGSLSAKTYTNKTFLAPCSHNTNIAMEYTTWHKQTALIDDDKWGGTIQATGFYEDSNNEKDLGKYFGVTNYNNGNSYDDFFTVYPGASVDQPAHWRSDFIFHTPSIEATDRTLADKLTWRPSRESYGVRLDYHQKLDKILHGLFFKVSMPIVHVKTSLGWSSSCCTTTCNSLCCNSCGGSYCVKQKLETEGALTGAEKSLADYLTGNVENTDATAAQKALTHAKIHNGNSETGIADIDFTVGYNFLYEDTKHVNANIGFTIPTGTTPDAEYLWEAVVGNHGHWALGGGLDAAFRVWRDKEMSLDFLFAFNYRYLFPSTEKRTLGYKWPKSNSFGSINLDGISRNYVGKKAMYGHWILWGKKGDTTTTPAANFLTRDVKVTPGSHFDGLASLAFNYKSWTFDLGYNLFAKDAENVRLKSAASGCCGSSCCLPWEDDVYGIADPAWDCNTAFEPTDGATIYDGSGDTINTCDLDLEAVTNPSVVTHKIFGGAGYAWNEWDYPMMLGLGGSYEFATDNDSLEAWSLWAKVSVTF